MSIYVLHNFFIVTKTCKMYEKIIFKNPFLFYNIISFIVGGSNGKERFI